MHRWGFHSGFFTLLLIAVCLAASHIIGLLRGKRWSWYVTGCWAAFGVVSSILAFYFRVAFADQPSIFPLISLIVGLTFPLPVFLLLTRDKTLSYFRINETRQPPATDARQEANLPVISSDGLAVLRTSDPSPAQMESLLATRSQAHSGRGQAFWTGIFVAALILGVVTFVMWQLGAVKGGDLDAALRLYGWGIVNKDEALSVLQLATSSKKEAARVGAAKAWGVVAKNSDEAIPTLIRLMDDSSPKVRQAAVMALNRLGSRAQEAIGPLILRYPDESKEVRIATKEALGSINPFFVNSPAARAAIPKLAIALAEAKTHEAQGNVESILFQIDSKPFESAEIRESLPALISLLSEKDKDLRAGAARVLFMMKANAKDAIPAMTQALNDESSDVQFFIVRGLGAMGPEARDAIPALEALKHSTLRGTVEIALQSIKSR